jgi:hypothetical protein
VLYQAELYPEIMAAPRGFEPLIFRLTTGCCNHSAKEPLFVLAGAQGFEPWLAGLESAVLPLDDTPIVFGAEREIRTPCVSYVTGLQPAATPPS